MSAHNDHSPDEFLGEGEGRISPEYMAHAFVMLPRTVVGWPGSHKQVVAYLQGFNEAIMMRDGVTSPEAMQARLERFADLLRPLPEGERTENEEREAILRLEPLIAELYAEALGGPIPTPAAVDLA